MPIEKPMFAGDILPAEKALEAIKDIYLGPPIEVPIIPREANSANISEARRREIVKLIQSMKRDKNALVLAHNYTPPDVQDVADYIGDSLHLAKIGRDSTADIIVEASVLFMNEILAVMKKPHQTVLAPSLEAKCSLAAHAKTSKILAWKREHPTGKVVSYVNTYLDVKAVSDICCASGNAASVIQYMAEEYPDSPLLFLPDIFLGHFAMNTLKKMGKPTDNLWLMMGACHVHEQITAHHVMRQMALHPDAAVTAHPECGCMSKCSMMLDQGLASQEMMQLRSTWGMIDFVKQTNAKKIIVATTVTNIHPMQKAAPDKEFIPANPEARCAFMEQNTLLNLYQSLRDMKHKITVDPKLAAQARKPIERMLAIQ